MPLLASKQIRITPQAYQKLGWCRDRLQETRPKVAAELEAANPGVSVDRTVTYSDVILHLATLFEEQFDE